MNDLMLNTSTLTMTSRAVADVTGKRHPDILRDIRNMLNELEIDASIYAHIYQDGMNRDQTEYILDKELTITLTSGYSITQRHAIIKRWLDLEQAQKTTPLAADTPATLAFRDVQDGLKLAELLGCPRSFAIQITCQHAERLTGYPVTMLANQAAACQNVPAGDVMLEPTEIGKLLDMTGADANKMLEGLGLQSKVSGVWTPTAAGQPLCIRHAWTARGKSGYNLKWRYSEVEKMRDRTNPIEVSEHSL